MTDPAIVTAAVSAIETILAVVANFIVDTPCVKELARSVFAKARVPLGAAREYIRLVAVKKR